MSFLLCMTNGVLSYWRGRLLGTPRAKARYGHAAFMAAGAVLGCGGWLVIYIVRSWLYVKKKTLISRVHAQAHAGKSHFAEGKSFLRVGVLRSGIFPGTHMVITLLFSILFSTCWLIFDAFVSRKSIFIDQSCWITLHGHSLHHRWCTYTSDTSCSLSQWYRQLPGC